MNHCFRTMYHPFRYCVLRLLRSRANIFWVLCFPIILGGLFKIAFSNMDSSENFQPIPVAIVEEAGGQQLHSVMESLSEPGDGQMLQSTYETASSAEKLLEEERIDGILQIGEKVILTISAEAGSRKMNQSILSTLTDELNLNMALMQDTAARSPEKLTELASRMAEGISFREEISYGYQRQGSSTQYFYNLMAMACLYTAMSGIYIAIDNQASLSAKAARRSISATPGNIAILSDLMAHILVEFVLNLLAFLFLIYVLRIDMATRIHLAILTILVSTLTGVSLGFFFGSISRKGQDFKTGMLLGITMICCFFSGLMIGTMRMLVEQYAPWFNRINPAALISDCFYCLSAYESTSRFAGDILTLCIFCVLLVSGGIFLTRRNCYASL